jgi:hypothetical protein
VSTTYPEREPYLVLTSILKGPENKLSRNEDDSLNHFLNFIIKYLESPWENIFNNIITARQVK